MRGTNFSHGVAIHDQSRKLFEGFTLIELLVVVAILGTLSAIAVPVSRNYMDEARNAAAIADIQRIEGWVQRFQVERGRPPDNLAEAGHTMPSDPWGHPYRYVRIQGLSPAERDAKCRWDKYDKPLNNDFDLYSMGRDGKTTAKITLPDSYDDIIRAHRGEYVGLASEF